MSKKDDWIIIDDYHKYKEVGKNKNWIIIRFSGDLAIYSYCPFCGYTHACYINKRNENGEWSLSCEYDPEQEFNFCPMCGKDMKEEC